MKYITVPKANEEDIIKQFKDYMAKHKSNTGKINFSYDYAKPVFKGKKPNVVFTSEAWLKINALVDNCSTEIGWHGVVEKKKNVFYITDVLVYPQKVTAATVSADDKEYPKWLMNIPDETFNKIRMQGHSHVNFGVTPSGTDNDFYNKLLQNMDKDEFYIFMIINKRKELNVWIYDFKSNIIFEKADILVDVLTSNGLLNKWYKDAYTEYITEEKYQVTNVGSHWNKGGASRNINFSDYDDYYYGRYR